MYQATGFRRLVFDEPCWVSIAKSIWLQCYMPLLKICSWLTCTTLPLNLSWQNRFNMCCILCLCFISLLSLKFVKLWFISAWFTPKVAAGRRICWRKKRSTLFKNGTDSSFSNISDSSIIATVTLHELPCCFSLFMKLCRRSLIFGLIIADGLNDMFGWIFNNMYKKCPKFALLPRKLTICIKQYHEKIQQNNVTAGKDHTIVNLIAHNDLYLFYAQSRGTSLLLCKLWMYCQLSSFHVSHSQLILFKSMLVFLWTQL